MALGETYAFWPEWMPNPQQETWNFQPEDLRQTTETEVGAIIRHQFDSGILIAGCSLVLNRIQSAWFEAFEKAMIQEGLWFVFPLWYAGELRDGMVMFKDRPKWTVDALTTTYNFTVLVQKRSLELGPCIMEMLDCWSPCKTIEINEMLLSAKSSLSCSTIIPNS